MVSDYTKLKKKVLDLYSQFDTLMISVKNGKETIFDKTLPAIESKAESIRNDEFKLMVVGEASSGKSSFINAYLGKEILPVDVLQCTSAIVEIVYGESYQLIVTYANGKSSVITKEDEIIKQLKGNAAISDEFRDIPVSLIDAELLIKKKGDKILNREIDTLLEWVEGDRPKSMTKKEYEQKIKKYIAERQPKWEEIVEKLVIQYPFEDMDLKGIKIIDTPGVNAVGRVGDVTTSHIQNANAVMFLKPIVGGVPDTKSFKNFLEHNSNDRTKSAMFFIMTRAANEIEQNRNRIYDEVVRQFSNIDEKQIILIDSKAEIYYNMFKDLTSDEIDEKVSMLEEKGIADDFLSLALYRARGKKEVFLETLKKISNFDLIDSSLNQFAHNAQYIALNDFLANMIAVIKKVKNKIKEDIDLYKLDIKDPVELRKLLNDKKEELNSLSNKLHRTVNQISSKYMDLGGEIETVAEAEIKAYKEEIAEINESSMTSVDKLKDATFRKIDRYVELERELQKKVIAECDEALIAFSNKSSINFEVIKPNFTQEDFEKLSNEIRASDVSYDVEHFTTGVTFKKTDSRPVFSQTMYFNAVKKNIEGRLDNIKSRTIKDLHKFVNQVTNLYIEELGKNRKIVQDEYNEIAQAQRTTEELQGLVDSLSEKLIEVDRISDMMDSIKGGVENCLK